MEHPDFEAMAELAAGERWSGMDAGARSAAALDEAEAWLERRLGGEARDEGFAAWLSHQPEEVQDGILGARRAELYRAGKLAVGRYADRAGGGIMLEELEASTPERARRASVSEGQEKA